MEPILTIVIEPGRTKKLPQLDHNGPLLLRWQILNTLPGYQSVALNAILTAREVIPGVGFLPRGRWSIPGGDQGSSPLAEIQYSPLWEWEIQSPTGYRNSLLSLYAIASSSPPMAGSYQNGSNLNITVGTAPTGGSNSQVDELPASTDSQTIPANADRRGGLLQNLSDRPVWVLLQGTPIITPAPPAIQIPANGGSADTYGYTGPIQVLWADAATGILQYTQITP